MRKIMCVISAVAVILVCDLQAMDSMVREGSSSSGAAMTRELSPADRGITAINDRLMSLMVKNKIGSNLGLKILVATLVKQAVDFSGSEKTLLPISAFIGVCGDTEEEVRAFFSKLPGVKFAEEESEDAIEKMKKIDKIRQEARYEEAMGRKKYMGHEFRIGYDRDKAESERSEINEQLDKTYHFGFDKSNLE